MNTKQCLRHGKPENLEGVTFLWIIGLVVMVFWCTGCDRTERDWEKAKQSNTVSAYNDFIKEHPQTPHVQEALATIETLDWNLTKQSNTVSGYNAFLSKHPQTVHAVDAQSAIEALNWDLAQKQDTADSFAGYLSQYPNGQHASEAQDKVLALQLRQGMLKADSVVITDGGMRETAYGAFSASMSPSGGIGPVKVSGKNKVYIFRNIPVNDTTANHLGIKVGSAYFWPGAKRFIYISAVDLSSTDKQLCEQFGLETDNSWHFTYSALLNDTQNK